MSTQARIEGRYFPAGGSASEPAALLPGPALERVDGEPVPLPPVTDISAPLGRLPRRIEFADGGQFEAPHNADLAALGLGRDGAIGRIARVERSARAAAFAFVIAIAALFGLYRFGLPWIAAGLARVTPVALAASFDRGMLATLDKTLLSPSELPEPRRAALARDFATLAALTGQERRSELLFRSAPAIGPNAFAMPGGTVLLFDQLAALAKSDDEILGVLAHELGHAEARHPLRMLYQLLGLNAAIMLLGGDPGDLIEAAAHQGSLLLGFAYSRDFEREADARSVALMLKAGRDPVAFVHLLERIEAKMGGGAVPGFLSTHPGTADRVEDVKRQARALGWNE